MQKSHDRDRQRPAERTGLRRLLGPTRANQFDIQLKCGAATQGFPEPSVSPAHDRAQGPRVLRCHSLAPGPRVQGCWKEDKIRAMFHEMITLRLATTQFAK